MKYMTGPHRKGNGNNTQKKEILITPHPYTTHFNNSAGIFPTTANMNMPNNHYWGNFTPQITNSFNQNNMPLNLPLAESTWKNDIYTPSNMYNSMEYEIIHGAEHNIKHQQHQPAPSIDSFSIYSIDTYLVQKKSENEKPTTIIPDHDQIYYDLKHLLKITQQLDMGSEYFFQIDELQNRATFIGNDKHKLAYYVLSNRINLRIIKEKLPYMQLHPMLIILHETLSNEEWLGYHPNQIMSNGELAATHFDRWLDKFRTYLRKPTNEEKITDWEYEPSKQYNDTVAKFNLMLKNTDHTPTISRIDLSTASQPFNTNDLHLLSDSLDDLLRGIRNKKLPATIHGFIWHLQYLERKGFYYHCMIFYTGTDNETESEIIEEVMEYWKYTILRGKGTVSNCEDEFSHYRKMGIGTHDFSNKHEFDQFCKNVLPMYSLIDQHFRLRIPDALLETNNIKKHKLQTAGSWFKY